jgi:hypothetical protein
MNLGPGRGRNDLPAPGTPELFLNLSDSVREAA